MTDSVGAPTAHEINRIFDRLVESAPQNDSDRIEARVLDVTVEGRRTYIGLDPTKRYLLLVPVQFNRRLPDLRMEALGFSVEDLGTGDDTERFLQLVCLDRTLNQLFAYLVSDILDHLGNAQGPPEHIIVSVVSQWRRLVKVINGFGLREATGFAGELAVLERLANLDPMRAVEVWEGSERAIHDFRGPATALEVKTWRSGGVPVHHIQDSEQLENPTDHHKLLFASVQVSEDAEAMSFIERRERLEEMGMPTGALRAVFSRRGVVAENGGENYRFRTIDLKLWVVDEAFPRLRSADLPSGIRDRVRRVAYSLDVSGLPGELDESAVELALNEVVDHE